MTKTETIISDIYDAWRAQDLDRLASYLPDDFSHMIYISGSVRTARSHELHHHAASGREVDGDVEWVREAFRRESGAGITDDEQPWQSKICAWWESPKVLDRSSGPTDRLDRPGAAQN